MNRLYLNQCFIALFIMIFGLSGCQAQTPSGTVKLILDGVQQSADGEFSQLMDKATVANHELANEVEEEIHQMIKQISYQINSEVIQGETADVNVTVYGPDLAQAMMSYQNRQIELSQEELANESNLLDLSEDTLNLSLLLDVLSETPFYERTADVKLIKNGEDWQLKQPSEGLLYVLFNLQSSMFETKPN